MRVEEQEALDTYSRVVTTVAELLLPSVASLQVMQPVRGGRRAAGGGSGVRPTRDPFSHVHSNSMRPWIDKGAEPCSCVFFELEVL